METKQQYIYVNGRFVKVGGSSSAPVVKADDDIVIDRVFLSTSNGQPKYSKQLIVTTKPVSSNIVDLINQGTGLVALRFNHIRRNRGRTAITHIDDDEAIVHYRVGQVHWSFPDTFYNDKTPLKCYNYWKNCLIHVNPHNLHKSKSGKYYIKLIINLEDFYRNTIFNEINLPEYAPLAGEYLLSEYAFQAPNNKAETFSNLSGSAIRGYDDSHGHNREFWESKIALQDGSNLWKGFTSQVPSLGVNYLMSPKLIKAITNKKTYNYIWHDNQYSYFNRAVSSSVNHLVFDMSGSENENVKICNQHVLKRYYRTDSTRAVLAKQIIPDSSLHNTYSIMYKQPDGTSPEAFTDLNQFNSKLSFCILKPDWETNTSYMYTSVFPIFEDTLIRTKFSLDYLIKPEWQDSTGAKISEWNHDVDKIILNTSKIVDLSFLCATELLDK